MKIHCSQDYKKIYSFMSLSERPSGKIFLSEFICELFFEMKLLNSLLRMLLVTAFLFKSRNLYEMKWSLTFLTGNQWLHTF